MRPVTAQSLPRPLGSREFSDRHRHLDLHTCEFEILVGEPRKDGTAEIQASSGRCRLGRIHSYAAILSRELSAASGFRPLPHARLGGSEQGVYHGHVSYRVFERDRDTANAPNGLRKAIRLQSILIHRREIDRGVGASDGALPAPAGGCFGV